MKLLRAYLCYVVIFNFTEQNELFKWQSIWRIYSSSEMVRSVLYHGIVYDKTMNIPKARVIVSRSWFCIRSLMCNMGIYWIYALYYMNFILLIQCRKYFISSKRNESNAAEYPTFLCTLMLSGFPVPKEVQRYSIHIL